MEAHKIRVSEYHILKLARLGKQKEERVYEHQATKEQEEKMKQWMEKKKIVAFNAGVIKTTYEIKSKTERIQIIVKPAEHHQNMVGL